MSLSCSCDDYDIGDWWHYPPNDFTHFERKRATRCCSCKGKIKPQDIVAIFSRFRLPNSYIEERIYGEDEVEIAPWFMCERCAGLYFSLVDLGYCVYLVDDMRELVKEYADQHNTVS